MLKLCRVTKVKVLFLVLVYVFNFNLIEFSAAILEKGLLLNLLDQILGVSNGPIQFKSTRKIWPLLELLAKITRVLATSCSQNFCNCSHARILVNMRSIARNFVNNKSVMI